MITVSFFRRGKKKDKVKSYESDTHKSLVKKIPGYRSYEDVNERLETDKAIRNYLYQQLLEVMDLWTNASSLLLQQQVTEAWRTGNMIKNTLEKISKLLTADNFDIYRHSTFFETTEVSEWIDVPVLYTLESEMVLILDSMKEEIMEIIDFLNTPNRLPSKKEATKKALEEIERLLTNCNELYVMISDRAELLASFEIVLF